MRVLVLLEIGADVRVAPQLDPRGGRVREQWLVREVDPASARALDLALQLKAARPETEVIVAHLGPPDAEPWLRRALASGCDRAVRVWSDEIAGLHLGLHPAGKAVILAATAEAVGFDLVLAGASGVINGSGQLAVLLAEHLGVPCVTQVVGIVAPGCPGSGEAGECAPAVEEVEITRGLDRGFRERVEVTLPLVATVSGTPATEAPVPPDISTAALLAGQASDIPVWDLSDLGVPLEKVRRADRALRCGQPRPRRPRLRHLATPDSSLPAFDRILELIQGSVRRREGRVIRRPEEEMVDVIFQTLKDEGWLDHLRPGADPGAGLDAGPGSADPAPADHR